MESIIPERRDFEFEDIDDQAAGDASEPGSARKDYFVEKDGEVFAGLHLIIDLWNSAHLDEPDYIETALIRAAETAGATVLNADFHVFSPNNGVSGVLILAESHISIHTWPERGYAAVDVFMCGACDPKDTIETLKVAFAPSNMDIQEIRRGLTT